MFFAKDSNKDIQKQPEKYELQKQFLSDMSYRIRNPLNSICGITELMDKASKTGIYDEQTRMYIEILCDSAKELQDAVNECFAQYENEINIAKKRSSDAEGDLLNNLRVLAVDDSEVNQMIVKKLLEGEGSSVTTASNGKEAVDLFLNSISGSFDIILMDIKMPIMDGYEATDIIRNSDHPQAKSIPIVAMTAETFAEDIEMAMKVGMSAHISKPISLEKIIADFKSIL